MQRTKFPYLRVILTAGVFVGVASADLAPALRPEPKGEIPHPEVVRLYEEVDAWSGEEGTMDDLASVFPEDGSWAASVRARSKSFELFCLDADEEILRDLLSELPYGDTIGTAASRHQVDALLVAAMIEAESQFDPRAVSPVGATGLMQLMPETALELGIIDLTEPTGNVEAGSLYLRRLLEQFDGDLPLALAAYNAGPSRVERYGGVPPIGETAEYVEKVLRRYVGHRRAVWQAGEAVLERASASEGAPVRRSKSFGFATASVR
ncbi:MAG TPA: lytic transglycosylase domain-containing protein [Thermoanaerobaculia bacterium]|nr:lytic transglycosylase domain-containing protein [Thermoanaerobaculia bacterium]